MLFSNWNKRWFRMKAVVWYLVCGVQWLLMWRKICAFSTWPTNLQTKQLFTSIRWVKYLSVPLGFETYIKNLKILFFHFFNCKSIHYKYYNGEYSAQNNALFLPHYRNPVKADFARFSTRSAIFLGKTDFIPVSFIEGAANGNFF